MTELGSIAPFPQPRNSWEMDVLKTLQDFFNRIVAILNRGITFTENVDCVLVSFTSNGTANTEDAVSHSLGKIPTGFIVYSLDKAAVVYTSGTAWTSTTIYLKTSVLTTAVKIIIF